MQIGRQIHGACQRAEKVVENKSWCIWNSSQKLGKETGETGEVGNRMKDQDHTDHIIKIGNNTQKSHRDLMRFAVTYTPVKDHQVVLV